MNVRPSRLYKYCTARAGLRIVGVSKLRFTPQNRFNDPFDAQPEALVEPVSVLNWEVWGLLMNFFLPGLKLKEKWPEKSAWKKRYEPARTAYQRLMDAGVLGRRQRESCASATRAWIRSS